MVVNRRDWPIMVRMGLWMIHTRATAWAWFWISAVTALISFALGWLLHPIAFAGTLMAFAAWWYFLSIRWVDENSRWS